MISSKLLSVYTVKILDQLKKDYLPDVKGWSKLKKDEKINKLKKVLLPENLPAPPDKNKWKGKYGIKAGQVVPYSKKEQSEFMKKEESNPLLQKQLPESQKKGVNFRDIVLQKHQKEFIVNFINSYFRGGLLFHGVGSGKTLTSVAFSSYYLELFPTHNVVIISPPSLLFNFVDTLRLFGLDVRDNRYRFETYEKFIRDYENIVNDKTLLIVDEAHLLRTQIKYGLKMNIKTKETSRTVLKGRLALEMIKACQLCNKVLAMTGTAFVNKLYDIENIMAMIGQREYPLDPIEFTKIVNNTQLRQDYFNYRISYFNVFDTALKNEFPKVNEFYVSLELKTPYKEIFRQVVRGNNPYISNKEFKPIEGVKVPKKLSVYDKLGYIIVKKDEVRNFLKKGDKDDDDEDEISQAYYVTQRQFGNVIDGLKVKFIINKLEENPKMKSIIYSSFIESSLTVIKYELDKRKIKYVTITGSDNVQQRANAKDTYNDSESGVNVLIISKAGTEGVDTKNTQQFFLYEPQWNEAIAEQAIARAVRFRSHIALPTKQRFVNVYRLIVHFPEDKIVVTDLQNGKLYNLYYNNINDKSTRKYGISADTIIAINSVKKSVVIDKFIKVIKKDIEKIEDFKEPYHKQLIEALDKYKNPSKILKKQREVLRKNALNVIKYSDKIYSMIVDSGSRTIAELQEKGEKIKGNATLQEFFTPPKIADILLSYSKNIKLKRDIKVLEPTAGHGVLVLSILKARYANNKNNEIHIDISEINPENRNVLKEIVKKNPYELTLLKTGDYLKYIPSEGYDLIVMNPPFHLKPSSGVVKKETWDIDFIMKAYNELAEGGEIVAIVSSYLSHGDKTKQKWIDKNVKVMKEYRNYKWKGTKGKINSLNFDIIRLTKGKNN